MKKIGNTILLIIISLVILVGCKSNKVDETASDDNVQVESTKEDMVEDKEIDENKEEAMSTEPKDEVLKIQDTDIENNKVGDIVEKSIEANESLDTKVKTVTKEIMSQWFNGMPYEVSLKKESGKSIAIINLIDTKGPQDEMSWYQKFQGSEDGITNARRIVNNLLQKDYKGEWISGVKILYNGSDCEFEHAPQLSQINYKAI